MEISLIAEFVNEYKDLDTKYVVVDSAEKLADLQNQDAFQEFLSTLLRHEWRIIFITRYAYLDDLKFQFVDVYSLKFQPFVIKNLTSEQLETLAGQYKFTLPNSFRLFDLLKNPFYLGQYLNAISEAGSSRMELTQQGFKNRLWEGQIAKTSYRVNNLHLKRERCFINLARTRADCGGFFITEVADCDENALKALEEDEIIERETSSGRFFISHDIYEEWALERLIEGSFQSASDFNALFEELGNSLPIRRAFRTWLSEQLLSNRDRVKGLIQASFTSENVATHWKDEILISVLLSDNAEAFFQMFERELLQNQQKLLLRVIFLLRIACKEIDEGLLKLMGVTKRSISMLSTVFTKPKGTGWSCAIRFLYDHRESIPDSNAESIPLLEDWTSKVQTADTTRVAGLLALSYYEAWHRDKQLRYRKLRPNKDKLIGIISSTSGEIKKELAAIFERIISKREISYQTEHYELVKRALSSATESYVIARNLPEQVLKLADLVWYDDPKRKRDRYEHHSPSVEVESRFGISVTRTDYSPASAFQTPIFQLLQCAAKPTLDFILSFTNRAAECYAKSDFGREVEEVEVVLDGEGKVKQYISARLWHAYRGMHVSTDLLESIHMALEKWLLEQAKTASQSEIQDLCKYLMRNSRSASITAVIVSVVLSQPFKLFNVATILFQTKEFFFYDTARWTGDLSSSRFTIGTGLNYRHKGFEEERIEASKDPHRRLSLEQLTFNYQLYRLEGESAEAAQGRQQIIGQILDEHYAKLGDGTTESEDERTWRLYLARMDRRKMDAEVKQQDGQTVVQFTPRIDPELKKFSEDSLISSSEAMKYSSLYLWSHTRFRQEDERCKQYRQYEEDPNQAILEIKSIRDEVLSSEQDVWSRSYNAPIPAYVCAVLIRDFSDKLSEEDRTFCKEVLLQFASIPVAGTSHYDHTDGVEPAVLTLPLLLKHLPDDRQSIKSLMFMLLIYRSPSRASKLIVQAILNHLWKLNFDDAQSMFLGYLLLKPEYEKLLNEARKKYYRKSRFGEVPEESVLEAFLKAHETTIETIVANDVKSDQLPDLRLLDLDVLNLAFQLLPPGTKDRTHEKFLRVAFEVFAERIFDDGEDKIDLGLKHDILQKVAAIVLRTSPAETVSYIKPFVESFRASRGTAEIFERFLWEQDVLQAYEQFWLVWNAFYPKIVDLSKGGSSRYDVQSVIHNYLFAWNYWNQNAKDWHTLKEREKAFFQRVASDMGHHPAVLYSMAKVLNQVGSGFFEDGIIWLSDMLRNNCELETAELEENTTYYLENVIRKYALLKRATIRSSAEIRSRVLTILNFLIEKGSVVGYLLREDVL